jgi:hypothetical protein
MDACRLDSTRAAASGAAALKLCGRMRVSGATILDQAVRLSYPFRESLRSLLPLVDELVVNVGQANDGTWEEVLALGDPRVKPFRSEWDRSPRGGVTLSEQTNLALARCSGDWIVYLQADGYSTRTTSRGCARRWRGTSRERPRGWSSTTFTSMAPPRSWPTTGSPSTREPYER